MGKVRLLGERGNFRSKEGHEGLGAEEGARDQRLHSDSKQNEGNAKVDSQEARSRRATEERAGQVHRAKHPRANVPQAARPNNDHIGSQRSQRPASRPP